MNYWLLEVLVGVLLVWRLGRLLERVLVMLAPRRWRESHLPPPPDLDSISVGGTISVLGAVTVFFFTFIAFSHSASLIESLIATVAALAFGTGAWAITHMHCWWLLEPGAPLRETLDSLADKTGISVDRVRLRESKVKVPRVLLNGSIELSTTFIRDTPPDEQAFMIAAALHQRQTKHSVSRWLGWVFGAIVAPTVIIVLLVLSHNDASSKLPMYPFLFPLYIYAFWLLRHWPRYSDATLRFALTATEDLETAERVVRRLDSTEAEKRLADLHEWWEKRQRGKRPVVPTTTSGRTTSAPAQQQTLGRKP